MWPILVAQEVQIVNDNNLGNVNIFWQAKIKTVVSFLLI